MKKKYKYLLILFVGLFTVYLNVHASPETTYINIETKKISTDGKNYNDIKEYSSLKDFMIDYNSNQLPTIYITNFLFDGVTAVKSPDLDDFIEENSNDSKIDTLEINVLNINGTGEIELTGKAVGMMIAVNTNDLSGNIDLILNGIDIDTDSKKAPGIFVFNKETTYTDCKVTIITKKGTKNYIEGGKLKKVSLIPTEELNNYQSYYSNENLINYKNYSSYYGIYNEEEVKNILFATVKADNEDLQDGDPYIFYKASGAISSDIDLYFEGQGYLKVTSKNKEGIETKGNLTFSGGTGDYEIYAYDDCLNTTTAKSAGNNVRNNMILDVNSLIAIVNDEGDEGDAIDSNGSLTINGGTIYAFANSNSQDSGLDSEDGIYINGGTIIATGNMTDMISNESKQKYIYVRFNSKIVANTLIAIKNQNDKIITAFRSDKTYSTLLYSTDNLNYKSFKIYSGGSIDGEEKNGLYTEINSYETGTELTYNEMSSFGEFESKKSNFILKLLIIESLCLIFVILYVLVSKKSNIKKY